MADKNALHTGVHSRSGGGAVHIYYTNRTDNEPTPRGLNPICGGGGNSQMAHVTIYVRNIDQFEPTCKKCRAMVNLERLPEGLVPIK